MAFFNDFTVFVYYTRTVLEVFKYLCVDVRLRRLLQQLGGEVFGRSGAQGYFAPVCHKIHVEKCAQCTCFGFVHGFLGGSAALAVGEVCQLCEEVVGTVDTGIKGLPCFVEAFFGIVVIVHTYVEVIFAVVAVVVHDVSTCIKVSPEVLSVKGAVAQYVVDTCQSCHAAVFIVYYLVSFRIVVYRGVEEVARSETYREQEYVYQFFHITVSLKFNSQ